MAPRTSARMLGLWLSLLPVLPLSLQAQQDTAETVFQRVRVRVKLNMAFDEMEIRNYRGAINILRELLSEFNRQVEVQYLLADCHYHEREDEQALHYLEQALANPYGTPPVKLYLVAGKIYHRTEQLEKALRYYELFRSSADDTDLFGTRVGERMRNARLAILTMRREQRVEITALSRYINGFGDEYGPVWDAANGILYFTSRRSLGVNARGTAVTSQGDYFEDIYQARWDALKQQWSDALAMPQPPNSPWYDAVLDVGRSGRQILLYRNQPGSRGDILVSRYSDTLGWSEPELISRRINSSYFEGSATLSTDGKQLFFISERPDGLGRGDIYESHILEDGSWSPPVNLGPGVNTPGDEKFVCLHPNGRYLFFATDGRPGLGSYDLYRTTVMADSFSVPVHLPFPLNTVKEESSLSFDPANNRLFIGGEYPGGVGKRDLFVVNLQDVPVLEENLKPLVLQRVKVQTDSDSLPDGVIDVFREPTGEWVTQIDLQQGTRYLVAGESYRFRWRFRERSADLGVFHMPPGEEQSTCKIFFPD